MLLITTALMLEARPVATRLDLKALPDTAYPSFTDGEQVLVVTGTGALNAAAATGWALGNFMGIGAATNIGFCGAAPALSPVHCWHYVNAIRDEATGRLSLPDILVKHPFPENRLLTVPRVVREDKGKDGLVDMEGSGFYEAARRFLPPDRIVLLKWVSDPLTGRINVAETREAYENSLGPVVGLLREWAESGSGTPPERDDGVYREIRSRLRLTRTQELFLEKWTRGYLARGGSPERLLAGLPEAVPCSKKTNTKYLERLKDVLKG